MSDSTNKKLRDQLVTAKRELTMLHAIDRIRDKKQDPSAMLSAIVNLVADEFDSDISLLILINRDDGELELKAVNDRERSFGRLSVDSIRGLAQRALTTDSVDVWDGSGVCAAFGVEEEDCTMELAVIPIVLGDKVHLGALLVARVDEPFRKDEISLLQSLESQLDSAVIQGYDYYELQLRNKELETIYRVDVIRDRNLPFDEMLNAVLEELRSVIDAEMGFIMLYDARSDDLELRAFSHDDLFKVASYYEAIDEIANQSLRESRLVYHGEIDGELAAAMAIPLILRNEILGVFGVAESSGSGFADRDRRLLTAIASQMDTAIFESLEQRRLRQVLGRSVDPRVMERLLANPDVDFLKGERQTITVLYADIRGSTELAENTEPESLVGFINDYLGTMVDVILSHEGTLDKFVGDEVMALFNAPFPQPDHALRAVRVGLAMQEAHAGVISRWEEQGVQARPIGIGLATGELIVGEMGSQQRTDYTVIGRAANLGARICSVAKAGQVLISQQTYDLVEDEVEAVPLEGVSLKGIGQDLTVYAVNEMKE